MVRLPRQDVLGRYIDPLGTRPIIVLAGCNSCSMDSQGRLKLPNTPTNALIITPDDNGAKTYASLGNLIVVDRSFNILPTECYDLAPIGLNVSGGKIVSIDPWWNR